MTATVFLYRIDTDLIDTSYMYKLDDFDWRKGATVRSNFQVGPKKRLVDLARTALAEPNIEDK